MNGKTRMIIGVIAALIVLILTGTILSAVLISNRPADYTKYKLGEDISVEVEDNGDVYLVRKNEAASLIFVMSYPRFSSGEKKGSIFIDEKRDMQEAVGYGISLEVNRLLDAADSIIPSRKSKTFLFNTEEYPKIKEVFYYDESTNTEYPIWNK